MKLLGRSSFVGSRRQPLAPNGGSVFDPITAYDLADYYPHVLNLALLASQRPAIERFSLPIRSGVPKAKCEGS